MTQHLQENKSRKLFCLCSNCDKEERKNVKVK